MSLNHAWDWSKRRSPLARSFRFVMRLPSESDHLVADAGLPESCGTLVRSVVRRTRLWPGEKADVARELIDHVQDALAAEHTPEQIVEQFGDPAIAAKLIRRARMRQRQPLLRAWAAAVRVCLVSPLIVLGLYGILWIRFHAGDPTIATNYAAMIEASWPDPGPGQPPYEAYELVFIRWNDLSLAIDERAARELGGTEWTTTPAGDLPDLDPRHPFFAEVVEAFRSIASDLDAVAAAAARPGHGTPLAVDVTTPNTYWDASIAAEGRLSTLVPVPEKVENQPPLWALQLPHAGWMHTNARLLAFDARLAIAEGDAERFIERIENLLGLARQVSHDGFLISSLVAHSIHGRACEEIGLAVRDHASAFDNAHLTALAHAVSASAQRVFAVSFETERMGMRDVLQRSFTDDGKGNGRLTNESYSRIPVFDSSDFGPLPDTAYPGPATRLAAPALALLVADRASQYGLYDEQVTAAERALAQGPAAMPGVLESQQRFAGHLNPFASRMRYFVTGLYTPALDKLVGTVFKGQAASNATLAAIAAESYRRDRGTAPASLDDLVPRYLPAVPEDPFAPGQPLRLWVGGETPVIYSVGQDGVNDGGTPRVEPEGDRSEHSFRARYSQTGRVGRGDWVLLPPAE